jgi:hypothetical protein
MEHSITVREMGDSFVVTPNGAFCPTQRRTNHRYGSCLEPLAGPILQQE